jgi:hypothetical protein
MILEKFQNRPPPSKNLNHTHQGFLHILIFDVLSTNMKEFLICGNIGCGKTNLLLNLIFD